MREAVRALAWPGMPAPRALEEVRRRTGIECRFEIIFSNEELERRMAAEPRGFDLVFPSDYLVQRLVSQGRLQEFKADARDAAGMVAEWARHLDFDEGYQRSVPLAFGTTGLLFDRGRTPEPETWNTLFRPPDGLPVGLLGERREVVSAALLACGRPVDDLGAEALSDVRRLLDEASGSVLRLSSEGFVDAVLAGTVAVHHAWSGPAAHAARAAPAVLGYAVPREGAVLWVTTAAIPADASNPALAEQVIAALMAPEVAALTVLHSGYATPLPAAQALLPARIRDDPSLFPGAEVVARCAILKDLCVSEGRLIEELWSDLRALGRACSRPSIERTP